MAETPEQKYCPWTGTPGFSEYCTSQCALYINSHCAFAWLGLRAIAELVESERQELLAQSFSKMGGGG